MYELLCPTCHGKGKIPDPVPEGPMSYCGPNGEAWPMICCRTCHGTGWVHEIPTSDDKAKP